MIYSTLYEFLDVVFTVFDHKTLWTHCPDAENYNTHHEELYGIWCDAGNAVLLMRKEQKCYK